MIQANQVVALANRAVDEEWGYVLGGQGQVYDRVLAIKWGLKKRSGKPYNYFVVDCARWFGHIVVDCSGLVIEAIRTYDDEYKDRNADTLYSQCTETGDISTIPNIPGICVWKKGHIGIYVGDGDIIEARSHKVGVVRTRVADRDFTNWGMLADVDYSNTPTEEPSEPGATVPPFVITKVLKYQVSSGEEVVAIQTALKILGYDLGEINGKYDELTAESIRQFQIEHGLVADGIVGRQTTIALGGTWGN